MLVTMVVGARPNFVKAGPIVPAIVARGHAVRLVHTGQHYDAAMSDAFLADLALPRPDVFLGVGSGTHAEQTAAVLVAFERDLVEHRPDVVVVVGDVNSTIAAALAAVKLGVPVAHVEAGLRSRDPSMPEEWNRLLTDQIASLLLTPSLDANANLIREGRPESAIVRVGNVMIDSLLAHLPAARARGTTARLGQSAGTFALVTVHRPSNVDDRANLAAILRALDEIASRRLPVVFPVHPRTRRRMVEWGITAARVTLCDPLGYLDFLSVLQSARLVVTDSGGIQEETTVLDLPCLTVRDNTERPITVDEGTNTLVGSNPARIAPAVAAALANPKRRVKIPDLWDGNAAPRIATAIEAHFAR